PGMERYWVPSTLSSAAFGTDILDYWFPVSTGGDLAFLCGVLKVLFLEGWQDRDFIRNHTAGCEALETELAKLDFAQLEAQSGLDRESMREFAQLIHRSSSAVLVWSMGVTQHAHGGDTVQMILNLGLTKGFVG